MSCLLHLMSICDSHLALHNAISPILAAIFSGNAIVVKCSEYVVWSTTWFVGAAKECLRACGHDSDIIQVMFHASNPDQRADIN